MRENRTSGSEGGAAEPNRSSLPLSYHENRAGRRIITGKRSRYERGTTTID